jgi:hypothetical protein
MCKEKFGEHKNAVEDLAEKAERVYINNVFFFNENYEVLVNKRKQNASEANECMFVF